MKIIPESFFQDFRVKLYVLASLILLLLIFLLYFAYQPTSGVYGKVYTRLDTDKKVAALTFDDGPNGESTLRVLDILREKNVHATFFLIGDNVLYYPRIANEIVDRGNEVGNHTMHHARTLPFDTGESIQKDLLDTNDIIFQATGVRPNIFRPPFGFKTPWAISASQRAGFTVVLWSDITADYYLTTTAHAIETNITKRVHPGSVIALHDGLGTQHGVDRDAMIDALPKIIDDLKAQGYEFLTVSDMFGLNQEVISGN